MKQFYSLDFAQAYGSGAYSSGTYSCTTQQQTSGQCATSTPGSDGSGNPLVNTGITLIGIIALACLLIVVGIVVRVWRRKAAVPITVDEEENRDQQPPVHE